MPAQATWPAFFFNPLSPEGHYSGLSWFFFLTKGKNVPCEYKGGARAAQKRQILCGIVLQKSPAFSEKKFIFFFLHWEQS